MEIINKDIVWEKATIFLSLSFIMFLIIINPFDKTFTSIFLSLIIIGLGLIPYIVWRNNPEREKIIPGIVWYGVFHIICFGLVGFVEHNIKTGSYQDFISEESANIAAMLVIMHLLIVFSGSYLLDIFFTKKAKAEDIQIEKDDKQFYFILILCSFFAVVKFIDIKLGGLIVVMMSLFSYMYLFYFLFVKNKGNMTLKVLACIGFLVIRGGFVGNIAPFVHLGFLLLFINLQKSRILLIPALLLILGILIYQPMKNYVRPLIAEIGVSSTESFSVGLESLQGRDFIDLVDIASSRMDYNRLLASFVEYIDQDDYMKWEAYKDVLYAPIPRFLWPDKPDNDFGNEWAVQEGFLNREDYFTSYNLPWLPQMYLSYGPTGIMMGSIIVAMVLFFLNRYYWTRPSRPWDYAMALTALVCMFSLDSDFSVSFGILFKFIIVDFFVRFVRNIINLEKERIR